jgi:hypothetical protein
MRRNFLNLKDLLPGERFAARPPSTLAEETHLALFRLSHRIARFSLAPLELASFEAHIGDRLRTTPLSS